MQTKRIIFGLKFLVLVIIISACKNTITTEQQVGTLKDAFGNNFLFGTALNKDQITENDKRGVSIITENFNAIVAENIMKCIHIHPEENEFDFSLADQLVQFGEKYNMTITGHTLIWHSQLAPWFCVDEQGNDVSAQVLKERIKNHITTIVKRYKGKIKGWDVLNEAISDNGSYRKTKFYEILGEDYIPFVYQVAHEADPETELYYNDFSMHKPEKREAVIKLIQELKSKGIRIDGVGMQGHLLLDEPDLHEFEESLISFSKEGVKVMITELDISVLPLPTNIKGAEISERLEYNDKINPYVDFLPDSIADIWNKRMFDCFKLFIKHHEIIDRVTLWGVTDGDSWKNNWPVNGRTDYPLLFDRKYNPKPVVDSIINEITKFQPEKK